MLEPGKIAPRVEARAAAARRKPRVSFRRDPGGALISFPVQSPSVATLIWSSIGLAVFLVPVVALLASDDVRFLSLLVAPLLGFPAFGFWVARKHRRPLHFYATQNGYFVAYRKTPEEPFAMGRTEHLRFDLRWDGESSKKVMPKYGDTNLVDFYCDKLSVLDVQRLKQIGSEVGIRVD